MNIWDFWGPRYSRLWVQKYSLKPTREYILNQLKLSRDQKILDIACGPGELIQEITNMEPDVNIMGVDFSKEMIKESKLKNPNAKHSIMDVKNVHTIDGYFDTIVCTHAFPYFKDTKKVMEDFYGLLKDDGNIYIGFASGNSIYDRLALFFVKFTTGPAKYLSHNDFKELIEPYFVIEKRGVIKERFFMPTIAIYTLKRVK